MAARFTKPSPLFSLAAMAVILASSVIIAAILGWIPSAHSGRAAVPAGQPTAAEAHGTDAESGNVSRSGDPMRGRTVHEYANGCANCGVVETVKAMQAQGEASGLGAVAGGVAGAVIGSQLGKGNGRTALGVLGAVGGAYAGHAIERNAHTSTRYRVTVRMEDGSKRALYSSARPGFVAGDKVRVVNGALVGQG